RLEEAEAKGAQAADVVGNPDLMAVVGDLGPKADELYGRGQIQVAILTGIDDLPAAAALRAGKFAQQAGDFGVLLRQALDFDLELRAFAEGRSHFLVGLGHA